jgi:hypothetical protein
MVWAKAPSGRLPMAAVQHGDWNIPAGVHNRESKTFFNAFVKLLSWPTEAYPFCGQVDYLRMRRQGGSRPIFSLDCAAANC